MLDYIHLNSVRAGLVRPEKGESVLDYEWSSVAGGMALPARRRPTWLSAESALKAFGYADTTAGRRSFVKRLDRRAVEEDFARAGVPSLAAEVDARCSHLRRGWYWGTQQFAENVLVVEKSTLRRPKGRAYRSAGARRFHDEAWAARYLREGLRAAGLGAKELARTRGSDPRKVALARQIWKHSSVAQSWLAERLQMGSAANVSQQLRRARFSEKSLPTSLKHFLLSTIEP